MRSWVGGDAVRLGGAAGEHMQGIADHIQSGDQLGIDAVVPLVLVRHTHEGDSSNQAAR